ncbi:MAG: DUF4112 domain-containing protein [Nitrospira sp.]|nr:DUF4112 domain-containing protein [Nitrospira sp.]
MTDEPEYSRHRPEPILDDEQERQREALRASADSIARLLDSVVQIPGTSIRFGLDALLGLIPGLGDWIANLIGTTILFLAVKLEVPKIVIVRMAFNLGVNTMIGAIPGLGDVFSIWFRSNLKNAKLLRRYTSKQTTGATPGDWLFVIGLLVGTFGIAIGTFALILWGFKTLWNL